MLLIHSLAVGNLFELGSAQPGQHMAPVPAVLPHHAAAKGKGEREAAAFADDVVRIDRERSVFLSYCIRQQA